MLNNGSDVTGWLSGNALDCGLKSPTVFPNISKFFSRINSYSILCLVTGTIDTAINNTTYNCTRL